MISATELYQEFVASLAHLSQKALERTAEECYNVTFKDKTSHEVIQECATIELSNYYK
jgi:hypothetical protein